MGGGTPAYHVSKAALNAAMRSLAADVRAKGVAVAVFSPGWVKTDMGGPRAPGSPQESARGALAVARLPFAATGQFWKDGREIPW